jgi:hypothetical protein
VSARHPRQGHAASVVAASTAPNTSARVRPSPSGAPKQPLKPPHPSPRAKQGIPPALRRQVLTRSTPLQRAGSHPRHLVDVHHIQPRLEGGRNEASNLQTLCSAHHRRPSRRVASDSFLVKRTTDVSASSASRVSASSCRRTTVDSREPRSALLCPHALMPACSKTIRSFDSASLSQRKTPRAQRHESRALPLVQ